MKNLYKIAFAGLKNESHTFDYIIDSSWDRLQMLEDIDLVGTTVHCLLVKSETVMNLDIKIQGNFNTICDRCGDDIQMTLDCERSVICKFGEENLENTDDIIVLGRTDHEIILDHQFYEMIALAIPIRRTHKKGFCNEDALKNLASMSVLKNEEENIDPRWDDLNKLLTEKK